MISLPQIRQLLQGSPSDVDLTDEQQSNLLIENANAILSLHPDMTSIEALEDQLIAEGKADHIFSLLTLKIVKSRLLVQEIRTPSKISVVFAVYKEHNRIRKSSEHPHGEDFLVKKAEQLQWLFQRLEHLEWELIIVDDGCPENSGAIAQSIIAANHLEQKVRVLYLEEAINRKYPPAQQLSSTRDSQKGGSIVYGMWDAVQEQQHPNHIIAFTDADLSTHLGQIGLLMHTLVHTDKLAAIGSRREPKSVVIKKGSRNDRGKLFIYLWKRLLPNLGDIVDTQCGFKAFKGEIIPHLIEDMIERKFAFDIELLLKTEILQSGSIQKVPIAWIDSEEASTTTDLQPYLAMLQAIVKMYRKYLPATSTSDSFGRFIEKLNDQAFQKLLNNIPKAITDREPLEFQEFDQVSASELASSIG